MSANCIIRRSFGNNGIEAFDLSIIDVFFGGDNEHLYLLKSTTIPAPLLSKYYILFENDQVLEKNGMINFNYLLDLLETIGDFVLQEQELQPFFYPQEFLNKSNMVREDLIEELSEFKKEIKKKRYRIIDSVTEVQKMYFNNLFSLTTLLGKKYYLRKKRISRQEFEKYIYTLEAGHIYTDYYNQINSFCLIYSFRSKRPVVVFALSKKNIVLVIIEGSESVQL